MLTNKIFLLTCLLFVSITLLAQTTFTTNGAGTAWNNSANWTCGGCGLYPGQSATTDIVVINNNMSLTTSLPNAVTSVTINNAILTISGSITFNASSISINSSGSGGTATGLAIKNIGAGSPTVNITGDVAITRNTSTNAATTFTVGGGTSLTSSVVSIGGNLTFDYLNSNSTTEANIDIQVGNFTNDNCSLAITGDVKLTYNYANPSSVSSNNDLGFVVYQKASVTMNNLIMTTTEGGTGTGGAKTYIATNGTGSSKITINGNATMNWNDASSPNSTCDMYIQPGNQSSSSSTSITIYGNLNMNSASGTYTGTNNNLVRISGSSTLTLKGNLNFSASFPTGASVDNRIQVYNTGTFNLYGSIVNTSQGSFDFQSTLTTAPNGTINFLGSSAQNFPVNFGSGGINYKNVGINNTSGTAFTIPNSTMNIEGTLTLTNGVITSTSTNQLVFEDGGTCPNGGSTTSYVTGPILKKGGTTNNALIFPTADATGVGTYYWAPIQVASLTGADATTRLTAQYFNTPYSVLTTDGTSNFDHVSGREYWNLSYSGTKPTVSVTLYWTDARVSQIGDVATGASQDLFIARYNTGTSQWNELSGSTINSPSYDSNTSPYTGSITTTSENTYGYFTFAAATPFNNPLPITISDFWADHSINDTVNVRWTTNSELNNNYFVVLRSFDGHNFFPLDSIRGAGTSNITHNYYLRDNYAQVGNNYYKLINVDIDGKRNQYEKTIAVNIDHIAEDHLFGVYPNPIDSHATLYIRMNIGEESTQSLFQVFSITGEEVTNSCLFSKISLSEFEISSNTLASGIYTIVCNKPSLKPVKLIVR